MASAVAAAARGDTSEIRRLLEEGADPRPPLCAAASKGHVECVRCLVKEKGATVSNGTDISPLHSIAIRFARACPRTQKNMIECCRIIARHGEEMDVCDEHGWTPLHHAVVHNAYRLAQVLIDLGANTRARTVYGTEPIHLCVARKKASCEMLSLLIDMGASPNVDTQPPLLEAVRNGHTDLVEILLKAGATPTVANSIGCTSLHYAASYGDEATSRLLVAHGADVNADNLFGVTPAHVAACKGVVNVLRLLVEAGASVTARDGHGNTPAHEAARYGRIECSKYLYEVEPALQRIRNVITSKPHHCAISTDNVEWLREFQNQKDVARSDLAHFCAIFGAHRCLRHLVEGGSVPGERLSDLMRAAEQHERRSIVEFLVDRGEVPRTSFGESEGVAKLEALRLGASREFVEAAEANARALSSKAESEQAFARAMETVGHNSSEMHYWNAERVECAKHRPGSVSTPQWPLNSGHFAVLCALQKATRAREAYELSVCRANAATKHAQEVLSVFEEWSRGSARVE